MTAIALHAASRRSILAELLDRQRPLALYGLTLLALAAVTFALQAIDARMLDSGVNAWVKPTKFLVSIGVFAITAAWFFGYIRPERRRAGFLRATATLLILAGIFELAWISWQGFHGLESHFNTSTPFHAVMYGLMGLFAVLLVSTTLPLAWEIGLRPAKGLQSDFVAAVVVGLLLTFILGGGLGGYMSSQPGHAVGAEGHGIALFGWNRLGGDLRVSHFLGIHAQQALPLLAAAMAGLATRTRWRILIAGTIAYVIATLALFFQAISGAPLFPL